jgi:rSAM/selenodomain-associated transferase 2/rSAM/selenodomain-associated transferase 1
MPAGCREHLIIFTRYPQAGKTKTRLIPALGAQGAAELQRRMTEHVLTTALALSQSRAMTIEIAYAGGNLELMQNWIGPGLKCRPQSEGDIGQRMRCALSDAFEAGHERVMIIGSDVPGITASIIRRAFDDLQTHDIVLGPAEDGGYYLIGMHRRAAATASAALFASVHWSSADVLSQTLGIAARLGLRFSLVDTLPDIDRPEDLVHLGHSLQPERSTAKISVIIPTLNEADQIAATLSDLSRMAEVETIVVDGGSRDATADLAEALGARVLRNAPSRAAQMNAGAAAASGDILIFLHADTQLPKKFHHAVSQSTQQRGFTAGAFSLRIDSGLWGLRIIERVANWRSRVLGMPYGDQAIFLPRRLFFQIGGYQDMPIMEDFEFVRRLRRLGKLVIRSECVQTSARRWLTLGIFKTWLTNQLMIAGYFLGISPQHLATWYRRDRGKVRG